VVVSAGVSLDVRLHAASIAHATSTAVMAARILVNFVMIIYAPLEAITGFATMQPGQNMPATLDIARMLTARQHIDPVFLDTPLVGHPALDAALGCSLVSKVETLNPIRSFKGRGTELFANAELRTGEGLVCASAGNFGQGLARAVTKRGHTCVVFAAEAANPLKVAAMQRLGAEVRLTGADFDEAKDAARVFARESGLRFVEDGAEPTIAEGAGTIGLELTAAAPQVDTVIVPLGNGALLAGVGAAIRHTAPQIEIIAVVAERAPAMQLSLGEGRVVETERTDTIADGIEVRVPVPEALTMLEGRYDAVVAVSERDIVAAMQMAHEHLGLVLEPAGAVGLAAILADPSRYRARRIATILTGSNISTEMRDQLFARRA
jgi:threonine dehydratase